jgi:amidophosphoribosyltransferase
MIACRDPLGIRPLVMGKIGDAPSFASETVALDVVGADFVREDRTRRIVEVRADGR